MDADGSKQRERPAGRKDKRRKPPTEKALGTCNNYNDSECPYAEKCCFLHLCKQYAESRCRLGKECPKNHNIRDKNVLAILKKHEIRTEGPPKEIRDALRCALKEKKEAAARKWEECKASSNALSKSSKNSKVGGTNDSSSEADSSSEESEEIKEQIAQRSGKKNRHIAQTDRKDTSLRPPSLKAPKTCYYYNESECRKDECQFLHLCKDYVENECTRAKDCPKNHNIFDKQVLTILEKFNMETNVPAEKILADLRRTREKSKVSPESTISKEENTPAKTLLRTAKQGRRQESREFVDDKREKDQDQQSKGTKGAQKTLGDYKVVPTVCYYYLRGKCFYKDSCYKVHCDLPYQWRFKLASEEEWKILSLDENIRIEEKYSNPNYQQDSVSIGGSDRLKVMLNNMIGFDEKNNMYDIQRLSTSSSVEFANELLTTEWVWYWQNEQNNWMKYGEAKSSITTDKTSTDLEQAYIANPAGKMIFKTSTNEYIMDFQRMSQCNIVTGVERKVCRRPVFVSKLEVEEKKELLCTGKKKTVAVVSTAPPQWSVKLADISDHFALIKIEESNPSTRDEYKNIEKMFLDTLQGNATIKSVERIENGELWANYVSKREKMMKKSTSKTVGERQLFHGTRSRYIEAICKQGFDFRLSGQTTGTLYGKGSYFAATSKYSNDYSDFSDRAMFVVKVLVGEFTLGKPEYARPPPKNPDDLCSPLYDSCVNNVSTPSIFVIFEFSQVYPEYLIRYDYKSGV